MTLFDLMDAAAASSLTHSQRWVLVWMARRAAGPRGELGQAYPSVADLVECTGLSRATVTRALAELRRAGWLVRIGKRRQVAVYVLRDGTSGPPTRLTMSPNQAHHEPGSQRARLTMSLDQAHHEPRPGSPRATEEALEEAHEEALPPNPPPVEGGTQQATPDTPAGALASRWARSGVDVGPLHPLTPDGFVELRRGLRRYGMSLPKATPFEVAAAAVAAAVEHERQRDGPVGAQVDHDHDHDHDDDHDGTLIDFPALMEAL